MRQEAKGAREEEQKKDTNRDRSQIKTDEWEKHEKAKEAVRVQKKTEDHFEESPSL